jgi:hypothetical protein
MTKFKIIEDRSPYYIKFIYPEYADDFKLMKDISDTLKFSPWFYTKPSTINFHGSNLEKQQQEYISENNECAKALKLKLGGFNMTSKHGLSAIHLDRSTLGVCPYKLMYGIKILDDTCITSWYNSEDVTPIDTFYIDNDAPTPTPVATTIITVNEAILFNTSIYHTWINYGTNDRILANFYEPSGTTTFDEAKNILFEI